VAQCQYGDVRTQFQHGTKKWFQFQHWASANMGANMYVPMITAVEFNFS
jgi:hypothetical protein